jgi:hypothetical protein
LKNRAGELRQPPQELALGRAVRSCADLSSTAAPGAFPGVRGGRFPGSARLRKVAIRLFLSALLATIAALAGNALAQDVPGRVGRISAIEGSAALYQDPDRGWEDADVNAPITSRNSVRTDPGGRAEVFHYGRWVHVRDRWAWCPGRRVDRPSWAPALVGFIGPPPAAPAARSNPINNRSGRSSRSRRRPSRGPPPGHGPPDEREKHEDEGKRGRGEGG